MGQLKPQPRILTCWRIILSLIMVIPAFVNALLFDIRGFVWISLTAAWIVAFLVIYVVYLPVRYQKLSFTVTGDRILVYSGVLFTRVRSIPLRNIQFTVIYRTPLDRVFGLCSLVATAAGGRIALPGLRLADAESLAGALLEPKL